MLIIENIEGDTASVIYWEGTGKFLDDRTLSLNVWEDAGNRWADVTFTRNSDGTLAGNWSGGGAMANATMKKEQ